MHSVTLRRLQRFEEEARRLDNPRVYLERLSPLHDTWHQFQRTSRPVGFLMFHWHVVAHFKALGLDGAMGVTPYTVADFHAGGTFAEADWDFFMGGLAASTTLDDLTVYSREIERWHNEAHMVIGDLTGAPMMDPRLNVFYTPFWNLHLFINQRFEEQLQSYAGAQHPPLQTPSATIGHIEGQHHSYVALI